MNDETKMYETTKYRCLVYSKRISDDIFLKLCCVEHCISDYKFNWCYRNNGAWNPKGKME